MKPGSATPLDTRSGVTLRGLPVIKVRLESLGELHGIVMDAAVEPGLPTKSLFETLFHHDRVAHAKTLFRYVTAALPVTGMPNILDAPSLKLRGWLSPLAPVIPFLEQLPHRTP